MAWENLGKLTEIEDTRAETGLDLIFSTFVADCTGLLAGLKKEWIQQLDQFFCHFIKLVSSANFSINNNCCI